VPSKLLLDAAAHLAAHSAEVHAAWRKRMERFAPCVPHLPLLMKLDPALHIRSPALLAQQGHDLAAHGVPAECAAAAMAMYFESCVPLLKPGWTAAFARFTMACGFALLSGYTQHAREFPARLGEAYDAERRRLSQDLHDEIGHDLIVLKLYAEMIALDMKNGDGVDVRRKLRETVRLIQHALQSVRRLTFDLGPAIWQEQGFLPAVRVYLRQFSRRTGIRTRLATARLHVAMPAHYETSLYKVLQGALANVAAHSEATAVRVTLWSRRDSLGMKIEDDGKGFDVGRKLRTPRRSFGLRAMRERVGLLGGNIEIASEPRRGSRIEIHLPLNGNEPHE
jgi:signal transduction histidine kinase